ncbi:MAG: prolipoprotein diacylglyceryl transferase, partial [Chloroflexota bacterium]
MIEIPFSPNIIDAGGFVLSWHGLLSFVGVAVAVYLVARWARRERLDPDMVYNTAIFAIIGGIIGARIVHVIDRWGDLYSFDNPAAWFQIWSGGIGLWGAILGGWIAGVVYAHFSKYPVGRLMDLAAPAVLIAQTIGRVGDIINGEHWSKATELPWGWIHTHPASPGYLGPPGMAWDPAQPTHPAVVYEMIWNMLALAVVWKLHGRLKPHGAVWMVYLSLYAIGRFFVQFFRLDDVKFWGLQEAHIISLLVLAVTVPFIAWKVRFRRPDDRGPEDDPTSRRMSRARAKR